MSNSSDTAPNSPPQPPLTPPLTESTGLASTIAPSIQEADHIQTQMRAAARTQSETAMEAPSIPVSIPGLAAMASNAAEQGPAARNEDIPAIPQVALTFLLVSGTRRVMVFDPETGIGRVKELVWNTWPSDWKDERPPAPSYLRILYLGKMLQDDETLTSLKFPIHTPNSDRAPPTNPPPTIVHLSIRAYPPTGEPEGGKKKKKRPSLANMASGGQAAADADGPRGGRESGCGCIIC